MFSDQSSNVLHRLTQLECFDFNVWANDEKFESYDSRLWPFIINEAKSHRVLPSEACKSLQDESDQIFVAQCRNQVTSTGIKLASGCGRMHKCGQNLTLNVTFWQCMSNDWRQTFLMSIKFYHNKKWKDSF